MISEWAGDSSQSQLRAMALQGPLRNRWKGKVAFLALSRASVKHISRESNLTGSTNQLGTASVQFLLGMLLGLSSVHI